MVINCILNKKLKNNNLKVIWEKLILKSSMDLIKELSKNFEIFQFLFCILVITFVYKSTF